MISVIVSTFDQPDALAALLAGLSCQTTSEPFEVIVCDDGSKSDAAEVVRHWGAKGRLDVKLVWQPDIGCRVSRSRNNGIRMARGGLLVFLDGDLLVRPDLLASHIEQHTTGQHRVVCGSRRSGEFRSPDRLSEILRSEETPQVVLHRLWGECHVLDQPTDTQVRKGWLKTSSKWMAMVSCNFSVPKTSDIWFDERFVGWGYEDTELAFRLICIHGYEVVYAPMTESLHLFIGGAIPSANPLFINVRQNVSPVIRNLMYFLSLYPNHDLRPALFFFNRCELDRATDQWYTLTEPRGVLVEEALAAARVWQGRQSQREQTTEVLQMASREEMIE